MVKPQDKQVFMNSTSPIMEHEQEGGEDYDETFSFTGCSCFRVFWRQSNVREDRRLLRQEEGEYRETWLADTLRPVKEVSEVLAGPKWKNFIRRVGKYFEKKRKSRKFQYDPHSYALNFDDGIVDDDGDQALFSGAERRVGL